MVFIETSVFTRQIVDSLPDGVYRRLQTALVLRPDAGEIIRGSGGLRKIRWALPGIGKRGALRIIYFWDGSDAIYMLFAYHKAVQEDLTPEQLRRLRAIVTEWLT